MTHSEIRSRNGIPVIESILLHRHLHRLGIVITMPDSRIPNRMLYGEIKHGHRNVGGQKKRCKDHIKSSLKMCNIPSNRASRLSVPME